MKKILIGTVSTLMLIVLLAVSLYVALNRQDIRQRAANDVEFMQVTPAERKKHGQAQLAVVLNKLDPKFEYRLIFNLKYEKNPDVTGDSNKPGDKKKTKKVSENKTYKFKFKADDCRYLANLDIQLYYRQKKGKWLAVDAPTAQGHTQLKYDCKLTTPAAAPAPTPEPVGSESASLAPVVTPVQPSPEISQPDDSSLTDPAGDAEDIDNQEDASVIDRESQETAPAQPTLHPSPLVSPATSPTALPSIIALVINPSPSVTPRISSPSPTPTPQNLAQTTSPDATPTPPPGGGFALLLPGNPNVLPAASNQTSSRVPPTPTATLAFRLTTPSPAAITATTEPFLANNPLTNLPFLTNPSPTDVNISLPSPTAVTGPNTSPWLLVVIGIGAVVLTGIGIFLIL